MELTFLQAAMPLTKTFAYARGVYATTPYPMASKLTSHEVRVDSIEAFELALREHSAKGHALLRGALKVPLVKESRAGQKLEKPTDWIVFDFDKVPGDSFDDVIQRYLPACCHGVRYVAQYSASMQIPTTESFSGHVFMQLDRPIALSDLRDWFIALNLSQPALIETLTLTASGITLHWPLDVAVTRAAQIIYIAPPKCLGFEARFNVPELIVGKHVGKRTLKIPSFTPVQRDVVVRKINELRVAAGMEEHKLEVTQRGDYEVLNKADRGTVHDVKNSGDHYLTLNLNGGDSRGYFIDLRNPALIGNFKGEPYLRTEQVDPDFYKALVKYTGRVVAAPPIDEGVDVFAFYATNHQSEVTIGQYNAVSRELRLEPSNAQAAGAWLANYGVVKSGMMPHADVVFDPRSDIQYVYGLPIINTYRATDFMLQPKKSEKHSSFEDIPPVIRRVVMSICGGDVEVAKKFINWLATIFHTRKKIGTAWVLHGVEGTGKGVFVRCVLRPLFGQRAVKNVQYGLLQGQFNDFLDEALIVVFEEASMSAAQNEQDLNNKLYHIITESPLMIHGKNKKPVERENFTNFIFDSNQDDPVVISKTNRRFNVAPKQGEPITFTANEFATLEGGAELELFADALLRWPYSETEARKVIQTRAAQIMHESTVSAVELIAENLLNGNIDFFIERMPSEIEAKIEFSLAGYDPLPAYRTMLESIIDGKKPVLKYEDVFILFRTLVPDPKFFKSSKLWYVKRFESLGIIEQEVRIGRAKMKGIVVEWKSVTAELIRKSDKILRAVK